MSKYFSPDESGLDNGRYEQLKPQLLKQLDEVRELHGKPITITSSYRGPDHPIESAKANGPGTHSRGEAVDIASVGGATTLSLVGAAIAAGFTRIGISRRKNFIHLDIAQDRADSIWVY